MPDTPPPRTPLVISPIDFDTPTGDVTDEERIAAIEDGINYVSVHDVGSEFIEHLEWLIDRVRLLDARLVESHAYAATLRAQLDQMTGYYDAVTRLWREAVAERNARRY